MRGIDSNWTGDEERKTGRCSIVLAIIVAGFVAIIRLVLS